MNMPNIPKVISIMSINLIALLAFFVSPVAARTTVDYSPDTTGWLFNNVGYLNVYGSQIVGGSFTISAETGFYGASIFEIHSSIEVGDAVKVLIFSNPTASPIISFNTTVDAIDSQYSTAEPLIRRVHASFAEFNLPAGTYWFSMPATEATLYHAGATWGDGIRRGVSNSLPIVEEPIGKPYFQLEGNAVPEPGSAGLLALGSAVFLLGWRKRR